MLFSYGRFIGSSDGSRLLLGFLEAYELPGVSIRMGEAVEDRGSTGGEAEMWLWLGVDGRARTAIRQLRGLGTRLEPSQGAEQASGTTTGSENITGVMSPANGCREGARWIMAASISGWWPTECSGDLLWFGGQWQLPCLSAA